MPSSTAFAGVVARPHIGDNVSKQVSFQNSCQLDQLRNAGKHRGFSLQLHCHNDRLDETLTLKGSANINIRRTSQKPSDELYKNFKAKFPALGTSGVPPVDVPDEPDQALPATSLAEALDIPPNPR
jgi:hypothetical protein